MSNEPMTQERLDAIRERVADATPAPWVWLGEAELASPTVPEPEDEDDYQYITNEDGQIDSSDDADLIEHAPQDLADLLAEVERLRHFESIVSWRYGDTTDGRTRDVMVERAAAAFYEYPVPGPTGLHYGWGELIAGDPIVADIYRRRMAAALDAALGTGEDA